MELNFLVPVTHSLRTVNQHNLSVKKETKFYMGTSSKEAVGRALTFWRRVLHLNFSTPCMQSVNNTGTKKGSIMK